MIEPTRRTRLWIGAAIAAALLFLSFYFIAQNYLRRKIITSFESSCATCKLTIDTLTLSPTLRSVKLRDIKLQAGDPNATAVYAKIQTIDIRYSLKQLLQKKIALQKVLIQNPNIEVVEGDLRTPPSQKQSQRGNFSSEEVQITDGLFSYERIYTDRKAKLHVHDIQVKVGRGGNTEELLERKIQAQAKGRLEKSGSFVLTLETAPFSNTLDLRVNLKLQEQNLADVTPFFKASDGVELQGMLYFFDGNVHIREKHLQGSVLAQYKNLDIKLLKTKKRSEMASFFSNLLKSITLSKSDLDKKRKDQIRSVTLQRTSEETIIQFILRGLRDAALKVVTKN